MQRFEKGKLYVIEFWATWCRPCIAAIPHLSALAGEYKERAVFLGIDIYENKTTPMKKVRAFVDSMGQRMDYHVAAEDSNFMDAGWIDAAEAKGIPKTPLGHFIYANVDSYDWQRRTNGICKKRESRLTSWCGRLPYC